MDVSPTASLAVQQLVAFTEALFLGVVYAAVYDLYRSLRVQFRRPPALLSFAADCLFWIAAAAAAIAFFVYRRRGEIHIYTYGGLAGGFAIYFCFFSKYLFPLWLRGLAFFFRSWPARSSAAGAAQGEKENKMKRFFRRCRIFDRPWRK